MCLSYSYVRLNIIHPMLIDVEAVFIGCVFNF
ncbi:hypothetical protein ECH_0034 [Ehrlichia chaffeensis str. Arkansas]|uniref:Uncharacterized protein n=1 Tax=Ehrlichia chaffeensis (strain ATCC CRL-10679 / Arkansas) TaxID=205920 RepID=Q2GI66_EHRCR|nr:hypothetical protein ECH_0034 [Ehrlichia chaffeensis str. Arkansas]